MIPIVEKYEYPELKQLNNYDGKGNRRYATPDKLKLPSVTTILGATGDKSGLEAWRKWVGDKEADRIVKEAVGIGSLMHTHLENYIDGVERPRGNNLARVMARKMADKIINCGLHEVSEIWGLEKKLYYPGLYAGTADVIGLWRGVPTLMDYKSAKKLKKEEYMQDYYAQLAAYSMAHDELFGTKIRHGVIFMADREYNYQSYIIEGNKFQNACDNWLNRLDEYYAKNF